MGFKNHRLPKLILPIIFFIALVSCAPTQTRPTLAPASPTSAPTETPTIQWFPHTSTPTPQNLNIHTSTPAPIPGMGAIILEDDFSTSAAWSTASSNAGSINISRNRLTIAVKESETYLFTLRNEPLLTNFYTEVSVHIALCKGESSYGMLIRAGNAAYRYALTCNGTVYLEWFKPYNTPRILQEPLPSANAPPGSPGDVRLGVWAAGSEMRFFLNDRYQFTVVDPLLQAGTLGLFAQTSANESAMTITFSELSLSAVGYNSPTPTLTATKTPLPISTAISATP